MLWPSRSRRRRAGFGAGYAFASVSCTLAVPNGGVELRIAARCPIVRRDGHLDVRIHAVVLHRPADAGKPPGVLRLRHQGPIDQLVLEVNAEHAAPGTGADHGRDAVGLQRLDHDVAAGTRISVRDRYYRTARCIGRVARRLLVSGHVPADDAPGEL